jgi:hypothetical protein
MILFSSPPTHLQIPDFSTPPPNWGHPNGFMPPQIHMHMNRMNRQPMPMNYQYQFGPQGMQQGQDRVQNYGYMGIIT